MTTTEDTEGRERAKVILSNRSGFRIRKAKEKGWPFDFLAKKRDQFYLIEIKYKAEGEKGSYAVYYRQPSRLFEVAHRTKTKPMFLLINDSDNAQPFYFLTFDDDLSKHPRTLVSEIGKGLEDIVDWVEERKKKMW